MIIVSVSHVSGKLLNSYIAHVRESTKHGPLWSIDPPLWTGSMDRVQGPPFKDRSLDPLLSTWGPFFETPGNYWAC